MYVNRLELTNFKSFGGTTAVPTLTGFTVISGPNGSGKSNLLDAILFALGLSGSKGMRAERLPDLVNHAQLKRGHSVVETKVTVSFALEPQDLEMLGEDADRYIYRPEPAESKAPEETGKTRESQPLETNEATIAIQVSDPAIASGAENAPEWHVTRRLRVTKQGTYTSNYAMNGQPCNLGELHDYLSRLRIYPEGYNVVLQGDVTGIITMNPRQRREIIDELAGVADFDRKINQAREKLEAVKEQEERFRIVEQELVDQRDRLARDRLKAEKYKVLRAELQEKSTWEGVLNCRHLRTQIQTLHQQIKDEEGRQATLVTQIQENQETVDRLTTEVATMNAKVKAMGEQEQLKVQAEIATQEAELRQLQRQQEELDAALEAGQTTLEQRQLEIEAFEQQLTELQTQKQTLEQTELVALQEQLNQAQADLGAIRRNAQNLASSADVWIQQQTQLRQQLDVLRQSLEPHRAERVQLQERREQLLRQQQSATEELTPISTQIEAQQLKLTEVQAEVEAELTKVQTLAEEVATLDQEITTNQQTLTRLEQERRDKQRQLDKLEAQEQAQQDAQGTYTSQIILKSNLEGVYGLVANLGRVELDYQLALETAAGARMGHLVVADDRVAAAGIELLKQERGGRATFLPLNKLKRPGSLPELGFLEGSIDYALNLVDFDPKYEVVFAFVFGNTVVFETLQQARRYIGQYRMVTLEGDLLEPTGAMTGGSRGRQATLKFGAAEAGESQELRIMRDRLGEIDQLLKPLEQTLAKKQAQLRERTQQLGNTRQAHREAQFRAESLETDCKNQSQRRQVLQAQLQSLAQDLAQTAAALEGLDREIPQQEQQLVSLQAQLSELEQSQTHGEWQTLQTQLQDQEQVVSTRDQVLREGQQRLQTLDNEQQRLQDRIAAAQRDIAATQASMEQSRTQQASSYEQQQALQETLVRLQLEMEALEEKIGVQKQARDRLEQSLQAQTQTQQELRWQQEKLTEAHQEHQAQYQDRQTQLQQQEVALPTPLPEVPEEMTLEVLTEELRSLQKRLEAMEPVNMLAIEEYDRTQARLDELTQKLETLEQERTDLLLRIEDFTTLRLQSFKEAFDAVNENFQEIFSGLSDGDGFLQLENPEDPFLGGLNLVAHPKGKPVQRLASMSGGEKSLTALSFIFALQRYRPSPFYALDEVDSFLDGVNVEKLARTIQSQAQATQFLVVSHRRPMIEAADRTIGVTQARGTHTQVIGMQMRPQATQGA